MRRRLAATALCAAVTLLFGQRETAAQLGIGLGCSIETTPVAFGVYDVFASAPTVGSGTISVKCLVGVGLSVALGAGGSGTYAPRRLQGPSSTLNYNLYTDAGGQSIWGNGTGGTVTSYQLLQALVPATRTVHARIAPRQDVPPGTYTDAVVASIVF